MGGTCCSELSSTGVMGCLGCTQCDWGGNACWEFWKCSPCCGRPDIINCILCWFNWMICCPCANCKLYATSLSQRCAFFPHCICCCFCGPCMSLFTRYNLRRKAGVRGNMVGDCVCLTYCCLCVWCQNLRSVDVGGWRIFPDLQCPTGAASPCMIIR